MNRAIKTDPRNAEFYYNRGVIYVNKGDTLSAERDFLQSIRLNRNFKLSHFNLGVIYFQKNQYSQSLKHYTKAIRIDREFYEAYNNRAIVYKTLGKKRKRLKDLEIATMLSYKSKDNKSWRERQKIKKKSKKLAKIKQEEN